MNAVSYWGPKLYHTLKNENGSSVWSGQRQNTVLTNDLGQFRLGSAPVRDSEIELRPAQLPRPPVLGSEEQCKHGDSIAGMGDRGLSSGAPD